MTDPTAPTQQQERPVPVQAVLARYREQLATVTEQLFIAQAQAAAAEDEAAQLRLRVIELEQPPATAKK